MKKGSPQYSKGHLRKLAYECAVAELIGRHHHDFEDLLKQDKERLGIPEEVTI